MILPPEMLAVASGLASAASWGVGDFSGGLAARKVNVYGVVILAEIVGLACLAVLAVAFHEVVPPLPDLLWAALAGLCGTLGLTGLYQAMAVGQMGVAAPVSAVLAASLPALVGSLLEGLPGPLKLVGFALGLLGLWLISRSGGAQRTPTGFNLAIMAGLGFAGFFIFMDQAGKVALFWPLVVARATSAVVISGIAASLRQPIRATRDALPWIIGAGACDVGGNVFFTLASQVGRLDISAVLSSSAPMFTIVMALLVVKERLNRRQMAGIALMLTAVVLFAIKETPLG